MPGNPEHGHSHCSNCGAPLSGPYCSQCGQHDVDYGVSIWHLIEESLEGLLHFDGKFLRSVRYLFARPGFLTREFNEGRRVRYTHPLRFYLFASFLFFLTGAAVPGGKPMFRVSLSGQEPASAGASVSVEPKGWLSRFIEGNLPSKGDKAGIELVRERFDHSLHFAVFLGIPLLALVLKLVFLGSRRPYLEHLIFSLHVQAFWFLFVLISRAVAALAGLAGPIALAAASGLLAAYILWFFCRSAMTVYGAGFWGSAWRLAVAAAAYVVLLLATLLAVLIGIGAWSVRVG